VQQAAVLRQCLQTNVAHSRTSTQRKDLQVFTAPGQGLHCLVCHAHTVTEIHVLEVGAGGGQRKNAYNRKQKCRLTLGVNTQ
jgi:hypothetical protein